MRELSNDHAPIPDLILLDLNVPRREGFECYPVGRLGGHSDFFRRRTRSGPYFTDGGGTLHPQTSNLTLEECFID